MRLGWLALALLGCGPATTAPAGTPPAGSAEPPGGAQPNAAVGVGRHGVAAAHLNVDLPWVASSRDDRFTVHRGGTVVALGARSTIPRYNIALPLDDGETAIAADYDQLVRFDLRTGKTRWERQTEVPDREPYEYDVKLD